MDTTFGNGECEMFTSPHQKFCATQTSPSNMKEPDEPGVALKNGQGVHFDYHMHPEARKDLESTVVAGESHLEMPISSNGHNGTIAVPEGYGANSNGTSNKKKKKKSKKRHIDATINDPDAEYPTSRVIKQAPNGDVIVESLEDEHHDHHSNLSATIWDNLTIEEQEDLKRFWESLEEPEKVKLVKIDKKLILDLFRTFSSNQQGGQPTHHSPASSSTSLAGTPHHGCTCSSCGRRSSIIEAELEMIYDNHFDDIIDFIHEVRDIKDLNALPGLLFGGFHMLEEEHRMKKTRARRRSTDLQPQTRISPITSSTDGPPEPTTTSNVSTPSHSESVSSPSPWTNAVAGLLEKFLQENPGASWNKCSQLFQEIQEAGNQVNSGNGSSEGSDRENDDKKTAFLKDFGEMISGGFNDMTLGKQEQFHENFANGIHKIANDFLNNNGKSFVEMVEALSGSRSERADLLKSLQEIEDHSNQQEQPGTVREQIEELHDEEPVIPEDIQNQPKEVVGQYVDQRINQLSELRDRLEEEYDYDTYDDPEYDNQEYDEELSDTESEISEEEKMQEIRRLFLIQVIKLFQERLKNAYKEKLSQDRTRRLIEELEAEENAKKEKELKKLKQKEKAKEKKRLQQVAKDEERRRKEEEERAREEELRLKQEELRAEQKRRKEEARQKKEEEKRKRIEELRLKKEAEKKKQEEKERKERELKEKKERELKEKEEREMMEKKEQLKKEQQPKVEQTQEKPQAPPSQTSQSNPSVSDPISSRQDNSVSSLDPTHDLQNAILSGLEQLSLGQQPMSHILSQPSQSISQLPIQPPSQPFLDMDQIRSPVTAPAMPTQAQMPQSARGLLWGQPVNNFSPFSEGVWGSRNNSIWGNSSMSGGSIGSGTMGSGTIGSGTIGGSASIWGSQTPTLANTTMGMGLQSGINGIQGLSLEKENGSASIAGTPGNSLPGNSLPPISRNSLSGNSIPGSIPSSIPGNLSGSLPGNLSGSIPGSLPGNLAANSLPGMSPSMSVPLPQPFPANVDNEMIRTAAYQAFMLLQNSNQLEYGLAAAVKLYQTTILVLSMEVSFSQFLGLCRDDIESSYRFDYVYDDYGAVSHIKASLRSSLWN